VGFSIPSLSLAFIAFLRIRGVKTTAKASAESSTHRSGVATEGAQLRSLKKLQKTNQQKHL
jgi:hypothetical protein